MKILGPLYDVVTFVLLFFHSVFSSFGLDPASGWAWALSIVGLVVAVRICLIPLSVRQIKTERRLQALWPQIRNIQAKYEDKTDPESRRRQSHEMRKLFKETGSHPGGSFLPLLAQAPIFFALFVVLNGIDRDPPRAYGVLTEAHAEQAAQADVLGASLADSFLDPGSVQSLAVTTVLIVLMGWTAFLTRKQAVVKYPAAADADNPFWQQQKLVMYALPVVLTVSALSFPIGVLLYVFASNVWSMGEQFHAIGRMPGPGPVPEPG